MRYYFLALGTLLIVCVGCAVDGNQVLHKNEYHAPPASMLANPGPMVGGPGPGVMHYAPAAGGPGHGGGGGQHSFAGCTSQVRFLGPEGMSIGWQIGQGFADYQVVAPGRYNFPQGATYRLKLQGIPGREGLVLYPSLQVYPTHPTTDAYLSHNSLPLRLTDEDLDQIETNNFVTKVIYLPDAKYQELAIAGVEELVSTRLDPGLDPVAEADRRGTIMAVLRVGNMDLEMGEAGAPVGQKGGQGTIQQTSHIVQVDGMAGQYAPPVPIGPIAGFEGGIPNDVMVGGPNGPGQPPYSPVAGMGGVPMWGYPRTGTPIGLQGPPHLPYGRPAGLQSHTIRNLTDYDVPGPVEDLLIDVRHEPGLSLPQPVKYIQYTESHPVYAPGEISQPAMAMPMP